MMVGKHFAIRDVGAVTARDSSDKFGYVREARRVWRLLFGAYFDAGNEIFNAK